MEITNLPPTQLDQIKQTPTKGGQKTSDPNNIAGQPVTTPKTSTNQIGNVTDDTVNLSADSLRFARSLNSQNTATLAPIGNNEQAQNAVAQLTSDIRNYPNVALNSHSNVNTVNFKSLLG